MVVACSVSALAVASSAYIIYREFNHIQGARSLETLGNSVQRMMAISSKPTVRPIPMLDLLTIYLNFRWLTRQAASLRPVDEEGLEEFRIMQDFCTENAAEVTTFYLIVALYETLACRIVANVPQKQFNALMYLSGQQLELVENLIELGIEPAQEEIKYTPQKVAPSRGKRMDRLGCFGVPQERP